MTHTHAHASTSYATRLLRNLGRVRPLQRAVASFVDEPDVEDQGRGDREPHARRREELAGERRDGVEAVGGVEDGSQDGEDGGGGEAELFADVRDVVPRIADAEVRLGSGELVSWWWS